MDQMEQTGQDRREQRRKRRIRNQILAYITLIILILLLAAGCVFLINELHNGAEGQTQTEQEQQEKIDALLGEEEELQAPDQTEQIVEMTPEQKLDEIVNAGIEVMPLEDKVAGLFLVTPEAITGVSTAIQAGDGTRQALAEYAVGGIIYFQKNIQSREQIQEMIDNTKLYTKYPLFLAVDEEGGSVSRVADAGLGTKVDSAQTIGASGDVNNAYQAGSTIGSYLNELGFNLDFAPVADLASVEGSSMASRSYGADAATVSGYVTYMTQGLQEQNVIACLKHFPGNGSAIVDTHDGIALTERTREEFEANEWQVFQAGIDGGAQMVMVGHISAPALTGDNTPCSLSSAVVTDILRNKMNFKGVIISDALNMTAITDYYSSKEAAVMALRAGCDMVLMPENFTEAYEGVLEAVQNGTISEERINDSLKRIYRIKYADKVVD